MFMKEDFFGRLWLSCAWGRINFLYQNKIYNEKIEPFLASLRGLPLIVQDKAHNLYFWNYYGRRIHVLDTTNTVTKYKLPSVPLESDTMAREGMSIRYLTKSDSGDYLIWTHLGLFETKNLDEQPVPVSYSKQHHTIKWVGDTIMYDLIPDPETQASLYVKYLNGHPVDSIEFPVKSQDDDGWIAEDTNGTLWISKYNLGLFCLKNKKIIYQFDAEETNCILRDHEGNIWINSKKGAYKISPEAMVYKHYDNTYFQSNGIDALSSNPDGGVWCMGSGKVFLYKNNEFYHLVFPRELSAKNGIIGLTNNSLIISNEYYLNFVVTGIKPARYNQNLLVGNFLRLPATGLLIINNPKSEISIQNNNNEEISTFSTQNLIKELRKASGLGAWIFYDSKNNLVLHTGNNNYIIKGDQRVPYEEVQALKGKILAIHAILDSSTDVFYTRDDSIYLVNQKKVYNLSSAFTYALNAPVQKIIYDEPTLYVSTIRNIYKCDNPLDILENKPVQFKLIDVNFKEIRDILVHDDSLYIASSEGLTIIPEEMIDKIRDRIPIAYFESIQINDKETDLSSQQLQVKMSARIKFSFASINYSHDPVVFSYMLEGYDKEWATGTTRSVAYTNLPRGYYTFKLKVSKPNSPWSEPIEYRIIVKATFWQHPLFFVLLSLLFAGLVALVIIRRKNLQMKRREIDHQLVVLEQKALQSMMNPHFIFNALSSIQSYLLQNKSREAGLYLSQFARLIRQNLSAINSPMISLDEEVDRLKNYLDLERLRMAEEFDYSIEMDESVEDEEVMIPSMIIQPFAENAILHGISALEGKGTIRISISMKSENSVSITIEDNGIGMQRSGTASERSEKHLHIGMGMTHKRLEIIGKKMHVETSVEVSEAFPDSPNPGTRVVMMVPVSYSRKVS